MHGLRTGYTTCRTNTTTNTEHAKRRTNPALFVGVRFKDCDSTLSLQTSCLCCNGPSSAQGWRCSSTSACNSFNDISSESAAYNSNSIKSIGGSCNVEHSCTVCGQADQSKQQLGTALKARAKMQTRTVKG